MTSLGKRLLAILLALMLCVSLLPAAALAEDEETGTIALAEDGDNDITDADAQTLPSADELEEVYSGSCGDDLTWSFDSDTGVLTVTGNGEMWKWSRGGAPRYVHRAAITSVELPEGLTGIRWFAFENCSGLTSVTIPESVTSIGQYAFSNCSGLTSVTFPAGLTEIGAWAFADCSSLTSVMLPAGLTSIGDYAFFDCQSLTSVTLPAGLTSIGVGALRYCNSLTAINVAEGNEFYSSLEGILYDKEITAVIQCPAGKAGTVEIPGSVTSIREEAFADCSSLTSVTLPAGLTEIEEAAFTDCSSLTSVTFPAGVTDIGDYAFTYCSSLASIRFMGSAPAILNDAFEGVTATAYYPADDETWTEEVRHSYGGNLTWVSYDPENTEPIVIASGRCGNDLTWTLTDDYILTVSGTGDMWDFEWSQVYEGGDTPWAEYARQIRRLVVSEGVTGIGWQAFHPCSNLTEIELPDTLLSIGGYAFQNCAFSEIHLPASLEWVEYGAFTDCNSLQTVYYDGTVEQWGQIYFAGENEKLHRAAIHCMDGDVDNSDKCGNDIFWSFDGDTGTLTINGNGDMWNGPSPWNENMDQIRKVVISEGVTGIGSDAFCNCTALTEVYLPSTLAKIEWNAFSNCSSLTSIELPENLSWISFSVFSGCTALTDITLPYGLTVVCGACFKDCVSLTSITIPGSVESISWEAFSGCTGLREITFGGFVSFIDEDAFSGVIANAYYPCNIEGWTEEYFQDYGGQLNWQPYEKEVVEVASGTCGDDLTWTLTDDGTLTISGTGEMWNWEPEEAPWSTWSERITALQLPDGLTSVGNSAFYLCESLVNVELPEGLVRIGAQAFYRCGMTFVEIPESVTVIEDVAFSACMNLTSVTIPAGVESLGYAVFNWCDSLTAINVAEENENYCSVDGLLYNKEQTFLLRCPGAKTGYVTIPDTVTGMESYAFAGCRSMTGVSFPTGLNMISFVAFASCTDLTSITIPANVTMIDSWAFSDCTSLSEILFEGAAPQIAENSFENVIATAYYPSNLPGWTEDMLLDYGGTITWDPYEKEPAVIDSGTVDENLTWSLDEYGTLIISGTGSMRDFGWDSEAHQYDGPWMKYRTQIRSLIVTEGVTNIGSSAFWDCTSLTSVTLQEGVTEIGVCAFWNCCRMTSVTLPESLTDIKDNVFTGCRSLTSVTLPESLVSIGAYAFQGCSGLTSVTIPKNVTNIKSNLFWRCDGLQEIIVSEDSETFASRDGLLYNKDVSTLILCPEGKSGAVAIPETVIEIGSYAFAYCVNLNEITFTNSAPSIGEEAFLHVSATVYYPGDDETWTEEVRQSYDGTITWVAIIASGECGDELSWSLDENGTLTISGTGDMWNFASASNAGVNAVRGGEGEPREVPWAAYRDQVRKVVVEEGVTSVGDHAFQDCESLTEVVFEGDAPEIGEDAFEGVEATVSYPAENETWTEEVFQDYGGDLTWEASGETPESVEINEQNFPDETFRTYVSEQFDADKDGWLSGEELKTVTAIDVTGLGVADLTGIEYFTELTELLAGGDFTAEGMLTRVDLSANTKLVTLDLGFNTLTDLDVTMLPELESLMVGFCGLTELDLSGNPALRELWCDDNALTSLDLSHNPVLEHLDCCGNTGLERLDISPCPKLVEAFLSGGRHLEWMQEFNPEMYESIMVYGGSGDEEYDLAVNTFMEIIYPLADGYYLIGPGWNYNGIYGDEPFHVNPENPGEYMLRTTLAEGDEIKVVEVKDNAIVGWYPGGMDNQYVVDEDHAGLVDVYFTTDYNDAWSAFGGYFWIGKVQIATVVGKSLTLKGNIEVNFYLDLPEELIAEPGAYVAINGVEYPLNGAKTREIRGTLTCCFTAKVKLAQLLDDQILRVYNGAGTPVILLDEDDNDLTETGCVYRAQDYIEYIRANSEDEKLLAVVNALSDVGSLAQAQFNYNADSREDVVNDLSTVTADMVKDYEMSVETAENAGVHYYGSSLLLRDATTIRHYFLINDAPEAYTFTVDGVEVTPVKRGSFYCIDITGIVARDLDRSFRVEVSREENVVIGLEYSAMSYAYTQLSRNEETTLTDLTKAVVLYCLAANEYFPE